MQTSAVFDYEAKSSYTIRVRAVDQGDLPFEKPLTITVGNVNEAPVAVDDPSYSAGEDMVLAVSATDGVLKNDTDTDSTALTAVLVTGPAHASSFDLGADGSFVYTPAADYSGADSFTYKANDGSLDSNVATVSITVKPVNDVPFIAAQTFSIAENSANGAVLGIVVASDADAGQTLAYAITAGNTGGAFAIDPATGALTVATSGALDYEANPSHSFSLTVQVTDSGPAPLSSSAEITVNVIDVNEAPVLAPGSVSNLTAIDEDDTASAGDLVSTILGIAVSDADTGALQGMAVTAVNGSGGGAWQYTTDGITWTPFGAVSEGTARLLASDASTRIRFVPTTDWNSGSPASVFPSITFRAWDPTGSETSGGTADASTSGGTSAFSSEVARPSITVNPVNDAPVLNPNLTLRSTTTDEDPSSNPGTLVGDILATAVSDGDAGAVAGMAVFGADIFSLDGTGGTWEYTLNGGSTWKPIGTVSTAAALLLPSDDNTRIRFVPYPDWNSGSPIVRFPRMVFGAWDQTSGTAGEVADVSTPETTGGRLPSVPTSEGGSASR